MNFIEAVTEYGLPDLPDDAAEDDSQARMLVLTFKDSEERVKLASAVSHADAERYCSRDDTQGSDWAVIFVPAGSTFA
jgi:hypothetical protein